MVKICNECGVKNKDDSAYCVNCGAALPKAHHADYDEDVRSRKQRYKEDTSTTLVIPDLGERIIAFIIDSIIISAIFGSIWWDVPFIWYNASASILFIYFTLTEYLFNTTLGKYIMELEVVNIDGSDPGLVPILFSSAGKSFFLPLDLILGWLFVPTNGDEGRKEFGVSLDQRASQYIASTVVVKSSKERLQKKFQNYKEKLNT